MYLSTITYTRSKNPPYESQFALVYAEADIVSDTPASVLRDHIPVFVMAGQFHGADAMNIWNQQFVVCSFKPYRYYHFVCKVFTPEIRCHKHLNGCTLLSGLTLFQGFWLFFRCWRPPPMLKFHRQCHYYAFHK